MPHSTILHTSSLKKVPFWSMERTCRCSALQPKCMTLTLPQVRISLPDHTRSAGSLAKETVVEGCPCLTSFFSLHFKRFWPIKCSDWSFYGLWLGSSEAPQRVPCSWIAVDSFKQVKESHSQESGKFLEQRPMTSGNWGTGWGKKTLWEILVHA